ncbi:uncharacterized protein [Solanum tuberosum]|uniref:uncharacterized protein n=1 Tax=Solanum tuberosum TaxID=4113 RepID=UPI000739FC3B|nr:PREDICTED: uncharacterized protein LOC107060915 [Solanum tuberosum]
MCYPTEEGGLGFKRLYDICKAFSAKRWWRMKTMNNLWSNFMKAKYCPRTNMVAKVINSKNFNAWRNLLYIRPIVEQSIKWKINEGSAYFWWDNWPNKGPLANRVRLQRKPGSNTGVLDYWWQTNARNEVHKMLLHVAISKKYSKMDSKWGWSTICLIAENYKPRITSIVVYWTRPQGNIWKLNTDDSWTKIGWNRRNR